MGDRRPSASGVGKIDGTANIGDLQSRPISALSTNFTSRHLEESMRSKVLLSMVVGATSLLSSGALLAQDAPAPLPPPSEPSAPPAAMTAPGGGAKKMLLGADLAVALPVGDFGDGAGIGIGILPRFEYTLAPRLALTGRLGYIYHLEKNSFKFSEIPVLVGAKYDLTDALYGAVELGLVHSMVSFNFLGADLSSSDDNLGATIGAGYRAGDLDFKLGLHILDLGNASKSMELVVNAGYNFWRG
jgi:hypothetical protein